ncbi:MAG: ATP-dependent Clp protease proteolytic subunit [Desulfobacteraceae bacterium]|nr:ATP-dependent Clp protease proteolytic subunit [Desulfobacteraceae bacterium]
MNRTPILQPACIFFLCLVLACTGWLIAGQAKGDESGKKVFVVPVSGTVDPGMAAFIKRVHRENSKHPDSIVILEIDTPGGRVDSALDIVDTMLKFPRGQTIAYVSPMALSAGAMIALSCSDLAMAPGSTIGDVAPIMQTGEGPRELGEKFQSPIRAKFRALAERNGYPAALVEAMVTKDKEVFEIKTDNGETLYLDSEQYEDMVQNEEIAIISKKTVVPKGELLTMHDSEAMSYGFSSMTAESLEAVLEKFGLSDYELRRIEPTWSETMTRFIDKIAPILVLIGLIGLYIEVKAPGFGLPGAVGVLCLSLVFFSQYLAGLADYTEFFILVTGIVLIGVEVFVLPGFGIAGFAGMVLIVIGIILAMQDFVLPDPSLPWQKDILLENGIRVLGSYVLAMIAGLVFIRYVMPRIPSSREGPYLASSLKGAKAETRETGMVRPGDTGVAITFLRPSGKAEINNEMFDVITENQFIDKDTPVKVIDIRGNRIIVDRREPE